MIASTRAFVMVLLLVLASCGDETTGASTTTTATPRTSSTTVQLTTTLQPTTAAADDLGQILVIGDWGAGSDAQEQVASQMAEHANTNDIQAILTTGDNFYINDVEELMAPFEWAAKANIPFWVTWGNHDVESERRVDKVNEIFDSPPHSVVYEWGPIDVILLDSNEVGSQDQEDFLIATLSAAEDPTIVVFHHAAYSCGSHGDTEAVLDEWVPQFDDDVFLVLNGHEHTYQRFEHHGVTYVVSGGGGATLTDLKKCPSHHPQRIVGTSTHHFVVLDLDNSLAVTAFDADGNVIDEFLLSLP